MRLDERRARRWFTESPVARLATVDATGRPHLVPVVFAVRAAVLVTAVDDKPKKGRKLRRLRDIEVNPRVALLVDHYDADWSRLWWVRVDGSAQVLQTDSAAEPLSWLAEKYPYYRIAAPRGPVIQVRIERWIGWAASAIV